MMTEVRTVSFAVVLALLVPAVLAATEVVSLADVDEAALLTMDLQALMDIPVRAASGFEQRTAEAPSSVTILSRDDLQAFGYRTLADALASVAGFYTTDDRTYVTLGVRGFSRPGDYNTRTLVLIDGIRVNDPLYGTGRVGTDFPLDLDLIERVEVVRGAGSSLYGSNALFSVINVVTRKAKDVAPAEVNASAGSYDAVSGRISLAQDFGEVGSVLVSGSLLHSEGPDLYFPLFDSPDTNEGAADGLDGEDTGSLFLLGRYAGVALQAMYLERHKSLPTASYETLFNDPGGANRDRELMLDLSWEGELAEAWQGLIRVGYQRYEYEGDWPYDYADPGEALLRSIDTDRAASDALNGEVRLSTEIIPMNRIIVGADATVGLRMNQTYVGGGESILDSSKEEQGLGVYLQDEFRFSTWLLVNAGLRYDRLQPYGDQDFSPRTALILMPAEGSTLKLIYGEAFRAPNAYERYYDDGGISTKRSPDLDPENLRLYEIVCEQRLFDTIQVNASFYRYEVRNLISQALDPTDDLLQFRNVDEVNVHGLELEARATLPAGLRLRSSYAYSHAKDLGSDKRLSNSPEHMGKFNLLAPLWTKDLTLGAEVQYISERNTASGKALDGVLLVNATLLAHRVKDMFDLSLSIYNAFDQGYSVPVGEEIRGGSVRQNGRSLRLDVTGRF